MQVFWLYAFVVDATFHIHITTLNLSKLCWIAKCNGNWIPWNEMIEVQNLFCGYKQHVVYVSILEIYKQLNSVRILWNVICPKWWTIISNSIRSYLESCVLNVNNSLSANNICLKKIPAHRSTHAQCQMSQEFHPETHHSGICLNSCGKSYRSIYGLCNEVKRFSKLNWFIPLKRFKC